jgi:hypothetical protein
MPTTFANKTRGTLENIPKICGFQLIARAKKVVELAAARWGRRAVGAPNVKNVMRAKLTSEYVQTYPYLTLLTQFYLRFNVYMTCLLCGGESFLGAYG